MKMTSTLVRPATAPLTFLQIVLGSLFIAGMAQLHVVLPFTVVPITGQTLAVLLLGASLGARRGAASVLLYLVEGSIGLPFFAGGAWGIAQLLGPTGGYLIGFVAAAYAVGFLAEKGWDRKLGTALLMFTLGHAIVFAFGLLRLAPFVGSSHVLAMGLLPFIPGEIVKAGIAASILSLARK